MKISLDKIKNGLKNKASDFIQRIRPRAEFRWILTFSLWLILIVYLIGGAVVSYGVYKKHSNYNSFVKIYPLPAAFVGGRFVWANDYYWHLKYINNYSARTTQQAPETNAFKNQVLERLIDDKIIELQALKYGVKVTNKDLDEAYSRIVRDANSSMELKKVLGDLFGMKESDFKKGLLRPWVLRDKLRNEAIAQIKVVHILMKDEGKAKEVAEKAKKGEDFTALAKQYSEDVKSRDNGGQIDWFAKGELMVGEKNNIDFEKAAFDAKKGEIYGPVKTEFGFEIIKVVDKKGKVEENFNEWITKKKKETKVWRMIKN